MRSTGASRYVVTKLIADCGYEPRPLLQHAFRQNIMQMQETARNSLMSYTPGASPRSSQLYRDQSEDSQAPMLHGAAKSSGLRYYVSDDGSQVDGDRSEEDLMMRRRPDPGRF